MAGRGRTLLQAGLALVAPQRAAVLVVKGFASHIKCKTGTSVGMKTGRVPETGTGYGYENGTNFRIRIRIILLSGQIRVLPE
jgi:hypothetical protein